MESMDGGQSSLAGKQTVKQLPFGFIEQFIICGDDVIILSYASSLLRMPRPYNEDFAGNNDRTIVAIG